MLQPGLGETGSTVVQGSPAPATPSRRARTLTLDCIHTQTTALQRTFANRTQTQPRYTVRSLHRVMQRIAGWACKHLEDTPPIRCECKRGKLQ